MVTITGTKEELLKFIKQELGSNCPSDTNEISKEKCDSYNNCEECALDNIKTITFIIKN